MADLKHPKWMYLKAWLFLAAGVLSGGLLIAEKPTWKVALLLGVTVWSFARLYYFMFYVIERYIDPSYRFAGIGSVVEYVLRRRRGGGRSES